MALYWQLTKLNVLAGDYGFELLPSPVNTTADEIAVYVQVTTGL